MSNVEGRLLDTVAAIFSTRFIPGFLTGMISEFRTELIVFLLINQRFSVDHFHFSHWDCENLTDVRKKSYCKNSMTMIWYNVVKTHKIIQMKTQITKSIAGFGSQDLIQTLKMKTSSNRLFVYALQLVLLFVLVFATVSTFAQTTTPVAAKATQGDGQLEFVKQQIVYNTGKVYFNWVVKANSSDCLYVIERSKDGNEYEPVGLKEGIGSPLELLYSWVDAKPVTGTAYYRIKQIDNDGKLVAEATPKMVNIVETNPLFIDKGSRMVSTK